MNPILWRIALVLWFPVAIAVFGVCSFLVLIPVLITWIVTGDKDRTWKVMTFGRAIWWDTTNHIADRAGGART
ncbi:MULTISPECIES: hypothetical protein [Streptomyces]|uniref:hypothetical protein n=1 Tax=Streptomyces TaxID=1883 RepID=UPI000F76EEC8|nr:hypothetical protein [Streptomyces sp. WAC05858]RSS45430.1 hypothetical protein EF902_14050 [Streptomyces sp. WAC05858]WTA79214.1 hypothetical protein OG751_04070 [Streptomyces antimycoticus]